MPVAPHRDSLDVRLLTIAFRDRELEREYDDAWSAAMLGPVRGLMVVVLVGLVVLRMLPAAGAQPWWRNLVGIGLVLSVLAATATRLGRQHVRTVLLMPTLLAPLAVLNRMRVETPHQLAATVVPNWLTMLVGACILFQLGFIRTLLVVGAFAVGFHVALDMSALDPMSAQIGLSSFYVIAISCLVSTYVGERRDRRLFLDERRLAQDKVRSEERLEREVAHQVAERSRELGVVLARSDATLDVRRLNAGERFAERYKIVAPLGAGGMGAVYEVERVTDGATLALKAVVGEVSGSSAARFAREAEIGARVRHPNLISIVDVGVSSGVPYLVMELVRGGSLEGQRAKFGDVAWALPILRQIAEGLVALHEAGVVHRDLKPGNVLLADGVAKISDFGISRIGALDDAGSIDPSGATMAATPKKSAELTGTGVVMGTPLYMAPEGAKSARQLDASADVFALGIIAYEMLTGRNPFPVPAFVLAMAEQPIPTPPAMDDPRVLPELRALVAACVSGDAGQRPRAAALLAKLSKP